MQFKTQRYELVEIQIGSATTKKQFNFPDLPNLTGRDGVPVIIDSITALTSDNVPLSPISGATVIAPGVLQNCGITIYQGDLQVWNKRPLAEINYVGASGGTDIPAVLQQPIIRDLINVSWTKSFITYADTAALTANTVFLIGVSYTVPNGTPFIPTVDNYILDTLQKQNQLLLQMSNQLSKMR